MSTAWGVYDVTPKASAGDVVAWQCRWRVHGIARKRTFKQKGHAKTWHDQLLRAKLMGWDADTRGWPIDPHQPTTPPAATPSTLETQPHGPSTLQHHTVEPARTELDFKTYCWDIWWPITSDGMGVKNMQGHRHNMREAIKSIVYRPGDSRCSPTGPYPGDSIRLSDLRADDLRRAVVQRRALNGRTAAVNQRRVDDATRAGLGEIELITEQASPRTVQAFYVTLQMIVQSARSSGHTTGDPLDGVKKLAPAPRPAPMTERLLPSYEDVLKLADAISTLGPLLGGAPTGERFRTLILAAGTLGARPGELVRHEPDWIELDRNEPLFHIHQTEAAVYAMRLSSCRV